MPRFTALLGAALALAACSSSTGSNRRVQVQAKLIRLQTPPSSAPFPGVRAGGGPTAIYPWSTNIAMTSYTGPVGMITLTGAVFNVVLYECVQPSSDNCQVNLAGPALQNLIPSTPVTINPDTYDRVNIIYCKPPETGYHSFVTGSVLIAGTTWFTRTSGNLGTSGPAEAVRVSHAGCSHDYKIYPPLVIADTVSAPVDIRLFFDVRDIAVAAVGDPSTNRVYQSTQNCTPVVTLGTTPYVCADYPDIVAVAGTVPPTEERYLVNGGAVIGLLFDTSDRFVGGFFRPYVTDGANWTPGFFPASVPDVFSSNGDGSYHLHEVSGADFPHFQRSNHSGSAVDVQGHAFSYTAVRIP